MEQQLPKSLASDLQVMRMRSAIRARCLHMDTHPKPLSLLPFLLPHPGPLSSISSFYHELDVGWRWIQVDPADQIKLRLHTPMSAGPPPSTTDMAVDVAGLPAEEQDTPMHPAFAVLLLYGTLFLLLAAQTALFWWKKIHPKSYNLVTLIGLWMIPAFFSLQLHFVRFLLVWLVYTGVTATLLHQCTRKRLDAAMPRRVYAWFLGVYKVSRGIGITGYALLIIEALGAGTFLQALLPAGTELDLLWYGLYFGVLGRDCAEVASSMMAATLARKLDSRINDCGICGTEMLDYSHLGQESKDVEATVQLSCNHCFHDLCIRGWTLVGKKDMCPVCHEKVDLKRLYVDRPWETRSLTWIQMLDGVRYLIVWNPIMFLGISALFHLFAPHHHHSHHHHMGEHNASQLSGAES